MTMYAEFNEEGSLIVVRDRAFNGSIAVSDDITEFHVLIDGEVVYDEAKAAAFEASKPFKALERPAFLFMAAKLGLDEAGILALIAAMPEETEEEQDAKLLATMVFENQQTFKRDNALLQNLVASSPITDEQVDAAWRIGEQLSW